MHKDDARVVIRAAGFWNYRHHRSFFDVRVFIAFAESNLSSCPAATFRRQEGEKRRAYEEHRVSAAIMRHLRLLQYYYLQEAYWDFNFGINIHQLI